MSLVAVNAEQAEDWNGPSGRHFVEQRERWERMRGRLTARLLAGAQIQDGENVLDIGCGCGDTTILAARASRSGHAVGTDLSRIQVAEARRLAAAAGVTNARFEVADAQVHAFQAGVFDVVLSTFGVMFFDDPAAAFGNLRKALRRGGRLAFLCWRSRDENPFFTFGFAEAAAVLGLREMPGPDAAFSLADTGRAGALLSGAGFGGVRADRRAQITRFGASRSHRKVERRGAAPGHEHGHGRGAAADRENAVLHAAQGGGPYLASSLPALPPAGVLVKRSAVMGEKAAEARGHDRAPRLFPARAGLVCLRRPGQPVLAWAHQHRAQHGLRRLVGAALQRPPARRTRRCAHDAAVHGEWVFAPSGAWLGCQQKSLPLSLPFNLGWPASPRIVDLVRRVAVT